MTDRNGYYLDKTLPRKDVPEIEVLDGDKFCKYCGSRIDLDSVFCPECGRKLMSNAGSAGPGRVFVNRTTVNNNTSNINYTTVNMGTSQPSAPSPQTVYVPVRTGKRIDKWAAFFLCLFLGPIGAHKFYEGRIGIGILYLLTGGLLGLGWLADIFIILTG